MKSTYQNKDWDSLSAAAKAEIAKVAIQKGIYSLDGIKSMYNEFADGGNTNKEKSVIVPFKQKTEVIITPDSEYNHYLNTLPDNQRFTPNDKYDSYLYWKLNGKPRNFKEAYDRNMFHYNNADNLYHANSIAWGDDGIGYFMKPKTHDTVGYELDWFNKGLITEEDGHQRPETPEEKLESDEFRKNYMLIDDPVRTNYYRYQPIINKKAYGGPVGTSSVKLGRRYWQAQSNAPTILEKKNTWVKQQKAIKDRKDKVLRKWIQTEGVKELNKEVKDYLTTSNATTWTTANRNPKNPHLQDRATKGAKSHALWEKEHPVLSTWGNVLGAVPFAVASAPLLATAGSGIAALGDAVAATSAGQAITAGLAPLATAASTSVAGAPLYTWADVGLSSLFGAHGVQTAINEGGISPTTALEIAPLGRLAKPMWDAGKQGLQYTGKAIDNATRYASPSYDLYRTIGETTPSVRVRNPYVDIKGLEGADKSYIKIKSSLENLADAKRGNKNEAYYLFAPKDIDILKLRNARFGNGKAYDGPILGSGSVDGKFVSYGEPWMEFAPNEKTALYEMPTGPRRGPNLMATDFRGNRMDYSINEAYNAVLRDRQFHQDIKNMELGDILQFKRDNYPDLIGGIPTDIYHANQTVIPNKNWNFDKFLKTPLWKYSEDSASGQVQKELMMKWPEAKSLETPTIEWRDAIKPPKITSENAANITPEQWTAAQDAAIAKGDMAEAQRLRDLHFKVSAPNTKVVDINGNPQLVIHKTPSDFTVFDNSKSIGRLNWAATPEAFGENKVFATGAGTNPKDMRLYINMKNPHYPTIDEAMEAAYINEGEDGILGIVDKDWTGLYKSASDAGEGFNMSLGVDNPYGLKSANAVTYDDKGVRIPLGKRDNFKLNDIRYGILPFGVGLTGYGLLNNQKALGGSFRKLTGE